MAAARPDAQAAQAVKAAMTVVDGIEGRRKDIIAELTKAGTTHNFVPALLLGKKEQRAVDDTYETDIKPFRTLIEELMAGIAQQSTALAQVKASHALMVQARGVRFSFFVLLFLSFSFFLFSVCFSSFCFFPLSLPIVWR